MSSLSRLTLACAAALSLGLSASLAAEEGADDAKSCIQINRIDSVRVVDSQHIRFEMSGGPDYLNTLPHKCPGLSKHKAIMYETSLSQLCDLDIITVLDQVGSGFFRGASCGLGQFVPIDDDAADDE